MVPDVHVVLSAPLDFSQSLLTNVSGYFVAAQAGVLGIIALALALVSLIAQRENSTTDIRVYYHESLAFQIVASSLALLAILVIQLVWPLQALIHHLDLGITSLIFEYALLAFHLSWLLINLAAIAYFIATTFRFVQQSTRELLRERYTANIIFPYDLAQRLREQVYSNAAYDFGSLTGGVTSGGPTITFGFEHGKPHVVELTMTSKAPVILWDVRMNWVDWVVRRWSARCRVDVDTTASSTAAFGNQGPMLWFTPTFAFPMRCRIDLCKRRGGVPLTDLEKFVLWHAFHFRRIRNGI